MHDNVFIQLSLSRRVLCSGAPVHTICEHGPLRQPLFTVLKRYLTIPVNMACEQNGPSSWMVWTGAREHSPIDKGVQNDTCAQGRANGQWTRVVSTDCKSCWLTKHSSGPGWGRYPAARLPRSCHWSPQTWRWCLWRGFHLQPPQSPPHQPQHPSHPLSPGSLRSVLRTRAENLHHKTVSFSMIMRLNKSAHGKWLNG